MPKPTSPKVSITERVEQLQSQDFDGDIVDLRQKERAQATLLKELVSSFRASEDMRVITAQRNKQLSEENRKLKSKLKAEVSKPVVKKESPPPKPSTAETCNLSVHPISLSCSGGGGSNVTLSKEQMTELADSVAALKEVACRRENTWEQMARRQLALQKQIKTLRASAELADRQLRDGAQTIRDQAAATKRDQSTIASLRRQVNRLTSNISVEKDPSIVEVMAPPARRPPRNSTPGDAVLALLARAGCKTSTMSESRSSPRREHCSRDKGEHVGKRDRHHGSERRSHTSETRDHLGEKREHIHGNERRHSESAPPMRLSRTADRRAD